MKIIFKYKQRFLQFVFIYKIFQKYRISTMTSNDQVFKYLNFARECPSYFIPLIERQLNTFINEKQMPLAEGVLYQTNQGKSAWIEARNFLINQKPLPPFVKHQGLCRAALEHRADLCQNGMFGHRGSDGSSFSQRILKHCKKGPGAMAEIIGTDFDIKGRNTGEMMILSLIIDDGVKDRGHRKTIFSPTYRYVGWSSGKQDEKNITVFNLTENNLQTYFNGGTNQNSFCGIVDKTHFSTKTAPQRYSATQSFDSFPVRDITNNNFYTSRPEQKTNTFFSTYNSTGSDFSKFGTRKDKKIREKIENTRTFYQQNGAKVLEITTKFIYNDGSVEQNIDRRTIYTTNQ